MGGFENKPSEVVMNVDDVARGIFPSSEGMEDVLPQVINRLENYTTDYTFKPSAYVNANNLWLAVLLIDADSGEIVQAVKANVDTTDGTPDVRVDAAGQGKIYDLQGRVISHPVRGQLYFYNGQKYIIH